MIAALALTAALTIAPASGEWHDLPDPLGKGQKMRGGTASLYKGPEYVAEDNQRRVCIRFFESRHAYGAKTDPGKYRGAYQFSPAMGVGAGWMVQKSLREQGVPKWQAIYIGRILRTEPVNRWAKLYQDHAFWLIWDNGNGRHHWPNTDKGC